jgi:polyhydroxyalkanoate synthesis regulator phasin
MFCWECRQDQTKKGRDMSRRRIAAIALSGALVAGGTGAAIAAVGKNDEKRAEQAVLDDAAKRLDVTPEKLRSALNAAQDAQIDEAVKAGKLTQKQADEIKAARKRSGRVLGPFGGAGLQHKHVGPGGPGFGMRHGMLDDIAAALGTTPAKLFASLRSGKSIEDVAKANGKSLADVRSAVKAAVKTRLDKAVKDGDLTQKQADAMVEATDAKLAAIESGKALRLRRHHRGGADPRRQMRPGGLLPGEAAPQLVPRDGTYS